VVVVPAELPDPDDVDPEVDPDLDAEVDPEVGAAEAAAAPPEVLPCRGATTEESALAEAVDDVDVW
jgi:hypothetical protein